MKLLHSSASLAIATSLIAVGVTPAYAQDAEGGDQAESNDNVIVVTAQRREQSIARTPIAVSALGASDLSERQVVDTVDLVTNVPNLTGNTNIGQSTAVSFFIRGVGTTENLATADPSVGVYVDDVYIGRQAVNNFGLFDIERIEVLRGPQGTLYGRNTNGGAVKIVTAKPGPDPEFSARASFGNYDRWETKLSANVPLSDSVYARANFLVQQGDGTKFNTTLNEDVDDQDYIGGRLAVLALPSDDVTIDLAFDYSRDKTNGGYASDIAGVRRPSTGDLRTVVSGTNARGFARTWGLSSDIDVDLSDDFTFTSITSYRETQQNLFLDLSDQPVSFFELTQTQDGSQFSQEFQVNGSTGNLNVTAGLYYFNERFDVFLDNVVITAQNPTAPAFSFANTFDVAVDSYAGFAQFEYEIGPVSLIAGARYTVDEREVDLAAVSTLSVPSFSFNSADLIAAGQAGQDIDLDRTFKKFTPKLGINWQMSDELFGYASYTKGFRSGGWTGRALQVSQYVNFPPENVDSYEVGLKANFAGGDVQWNSAGFYMEYTNLFNTLTINGVFTVQPADAEIYGFESELNVRASDWLDLFANVGILETSYSGNQPANLATKLQRSPSFQGKAGFSIDYPLRNGALIANGDVFYTSSYLTNPANLAVTAPLVPPGISRTDGFALVSGLIGYRFGDEDQYQIDLSCTNCFDQDYFNAITVIGGYAAAYAGPPRLWKVSVSARF